MWTDGPPATCSQLGFLLIPPKVLLQGQASATGDWNVCTVLCYNPAGPFQQAFSTLLRNPGLAEPRLLPSVTLIMNHCVDYP